MLNDFILNNNEFIGGWAGEGLDNIGQSIADGLYKGFVAIMDTVCEFIFWGSHVCIICCIIVFIASKDKKSISLGIKALLAYVISAVVYSKL